MISAPFFCNFHRQPSLFEVNTFGKYISWINLALVLLICTDVLLRYFFAATRTWVIELEWHLFAAIFLLGAAYAYKNDQHVRVDVFYQNMPPIRKAWINLVGNLVFLLPWTIVVIYVSSKYTYQSWLVREISPDPGGLPARYIIKGAITFGFSLLMLESIRQAFASWKMIKAAENP